MTNIVRDGYEKIAQVYASNRAALRSGRHIQALVKLLPKKSNILDIGCGAGLGVDDLLLKAGHSVIGIDNSESMIKMARKNCPGGEYLIADMQTLEADDYQVEAIVSFYALFHTPRSRHSEMLFTWASYLTKGGLLLVTMGDRAFEGEHFLYSAKMWSSQWGVEKNLDIVRRAGFRILQHEIDTSGGERHLVVLAIKN